MKLKKFKNKLLRVGLQKTQQNLEYEESRLLRIQEIDSEMIEIGESIKEGKEGSFTGTIIVMFCISIIGYAVFKEEILNLIENHKNFIKGPVVIFILWVSYLIINSFYKKSKDEIAELEYNYSQLAEERDNLS